MWRTHPYGRHGSLSRRPRLPGACAARPTRSVLQSFRSSVPPAFSRQVFNFTTYPHLVGLFEALGVDSEPSDMSFSLSMDGGEPEAS